MPHSGYLWIRGIPVGAKKRKEADAWESRVGYTGFPARATPAARLNGNPMGGVTYNVTTGTINFGNLGTIAYGSSVVITYDATAKRIPGSSQNLNRFRNQATFTYDTAKAPNNGGCVGTGTDSSNPCRLDTGYIVFFTSSSPTQNEVP